MNEIHIHVREIQKNSLRKGSSHHLSIKILTDAIYVQFYNRGDVGRDWVLQLASLS